MPGYSKLMIGFGVFLFVCGFLGWAVTGFTARGATAIASGTVTGALMVVMGLLSTWPGGAARSVGFYGGMVLAVVFGGVFVWRGLVGWGVLGDEEPKPWVAGLISIMAVASFVTFVVLLMMRPKPEQRGFEPVMRERSEGEG
jgi:MFS family permease